MEFSLIEMFTRGGALMWVLLAFSVVGGAVILERAIFFLSLGVGADRLVEQVRSKLASGEVAAAKSLAGQSRHPVARVVEVYLENLTRPANLRLELIKREGSLQLERVEARLRVLAAIAHLAPLVGLLGTVIGMVVAFAQIQALEGTVKPSDLAGGIWEALLTTVFGLMVAIPCMAAFHGFESRADKIARRMQFAVTALDDALNQSGIAEVEVDATLPSGESGWATVG